METPPKADLGLCTLGNPFLLVESLDNKQITGCTTAWTPHSYYQWVRLTANVQLLIPPSKWK